MIKELQGEPNVRNLVPPVLQQNIDDLASLCQARRARTGQVSRHHGGKLLSFDRGLVALHPAVALGLEAARHDE